MHRHLGYTASIAFVAFIAGAIPAAASSQQQASAPTAVVFDQVTVIDVEHGTLLPAQRVVIVGNRINDVGDARTVKPPMGGRVVDARGKYLIPGLWDMHVHPQALTDLFYPLMLANGVTGFRDAGQWRPIDSVLLWRREILAGERIGPPRQILSGQSLVGPAFICQDYDSVKYPQTCVHDAAEARHYVDSLKAAGADMIKPRALSAEMYFVVAAEARRIGIPFGGHYEDVSAVEASDSGAVVVDHFHPSAVMRYTKDGSVILVARPGLGSLCSAEFGGSVEKCQPLAARLRRTGTWLVPDEYGGLGGLGDTFPFHKRMWDYWGGSILQGNWLRGSAASRAISSAADSTADSTRPWYIMRRTGMLIVAGTDGTDIGEWRNAPLGFLTHALLTSYVEKGLTPLEALQTATLNPAKMLRATDSLGTVAVGKLADLVLLDANPLADITNTTTIRAVVANGRYYDRAALDQILADVQAKAKALPKP